MLFLLMIVLPFVELALLLNVGERIGPAWTLLSVIGTGVVGAHLARREGLKTMLALQREVQTGAMPGRLLVGGAVIFASGDPSDDPWYPHGRHRVFGTHSVYALPLGRACLSLDRASGC